MLARRVIFGRRDQSHCRRAGFESPPSNKSSFVTSANSSGGNSWYFQSGSEVRSLHIAKSLSFRTSKFPFIVFLLAPARSMCYHKFSRRLRRRLTDQTVGVRGFENSIGVAYRMCGKKPSVGPKRSSNFSPYNLRHTVGGIILNHPN